MANDEDRTLTIKGEGMARGQKIEIKELPMNKIKLGRNSRLSITNDDLSGLMQSINSVGLLQPIGVVKTRDGKAYEIAYGNRRFMAFSRLGLHSIPAVVRERKTDKEVDVLNLTENVQRTRISLAEIGRYAAMLEGEGLGKKELCVRLGVSAGYIDACLDAYRSVPKDFREDLEATLPGKKVSPGKISIRAAQSIINAGKHLGITAPQQKELFKAAKSDERFTPDNVPKYAAAMKRGSKDPIGSIKPIKRIGLQLLIDEGHFESLMNKYVHNGTFHSFTALIKAVCRGQKAVSINFLE